MNDVFVWLCEQGHETTHSELEVRSLVVHPRCPILLSDGQMCWAKLDRKVALLEGPK